MVSICTIEYLSNIRQLYILIPINFDNANINTKLYLNRDKKTLHTHSEDDHCSVLISVPGLFTVPKELKVPIAGDLESLPHVHRIDNVLIVQFRNVTCTGIHKSLTQLPCSKNLQAYCKDISCSNCGFNLFNVDKTCFKDLPNEHWLELLDCWSCHDNEFAPIAERALNTVTVAETESVNSHSHSHDHDHDQCCNKKSYHDINNSNGGLILPPEGKIYLGNGYLLMNQKDFNHEKCPSCKAELGEFVMKTGHIKIYRDLIKFQSFPQESFLEILMHRILDTIDNHSTFHFILKNDEERIYLRPIHWNLQVFDLESGKWTLAFKLGYSSLKASSAAVNLEAEVINCTSHQFNQISKHLNHCHENLLFHSFLKIPGSNVLKLSYLKSEL
jgi:hypothetical protein